MSLLASPFEKSAHTGPLLYPREPQGEFQPQDLDGLLVWATEAGASDITIQTSEQVFLETSSGMHRVTRRMWSNDEVLNALAHMFGNASIKGRMSDDKDADFAYDLRPARGQRYRFRVNAVGIVTQGKAGVQITLRTIPSLPKSMQELGLEPTIQGNISPRQGMILVCGATGSGKSTLLASIIRHFCEEENGNRKIITFESPIEFVYDEIQCPTTSIAQTEIGRNLPSFTAGTRNALRRKPTIILLGEARDKETISEAIVASMTGHLLFSTMHTNDVPSTLRRATSVFGENERNAQAVDLIDALRMIICQTLVPGKNGGRVALREFLVMDEEIRNILLESNLDHLSLTMRKIVEERGQTFLKSAEAAFERGDIDQNVFNRFRRSAVGKARDADAMSKKLETPTPSIGEAEGVSDRPVGVVNLDAPQGDHDERLDQLHSL